MIKSTCAVVETLWCEGRLAGQKKKKKGGRGVTGLKVVIGTETVGGTA